MAWQHYKSEYKQEEIKGKEDIFQIASVMKCSYSLCHFYLQQWHRLYMLLVHTVSYRAITIAINRPNSQVLKLPFQSKTWWAKQMKLKKGLIYLIHLSYIISMDFFKGNVNAQGLTSWLHHWYAMICILSVFLPYQKQCLVFSQKLKFVSFPEVTS